MTPEQRQLLRKNLYIFALAGADCLPKNYAASVSNNFSDRDYVTGFGWFGYANRYKGDPEYDMRTLRCQVDRQWQMNFGTADHEFLGATYFGAFINQVRYLDNKVGFYGRSQNVQTR
jgi:hypothetical protein